MNWLNAIGGGLGFLGGIGGLFSGLNEQRQAQEAEQAAIRQLTTAQNQDVLNTEGAGLETISGLTGNLNKNLKANAAGLGAAEAGAGVYNSSAVAGAVANEAAADSATIGGAQNNLTNILAKIKQQNDQEAAQMQYGFAANNLNYARSQTAGSVNGLASAVGSLAQFNFGNNTAANPNVVGNGNMNTLPAGISYNPSADAPGVYAVGTGGYGAWPAGNNGGYSLQGAQF